MLAEPQLAAKLRDAQIVIPAFDSDTRGPNLNATWTDLGLVRLDIESAQPPMPVIAWSVVKRGSIGSKISSR
jgi:hypothetical protein